MLYRCVTWCLCSCHYDALRRAHYNLLTRCIGWRKHNRTDHPIYYLDTLVKTGSESIEATLRKRRILLVGFVARIADTRLRKCVMFRELVGGAVSTGGQKRECMSCLLDDLRAFDVSRTTSGVSQLKMPKNGTRYSELFIQKQVSNSCVNVFSTYETG